LKNNVKNVNPYPQNETNMHVVMILV